MIKQICGNCDCYQPLYTKLSFRFWEENLGYCAQCKRGVNKNGQCPLWRKKQPRKTDAVARLNEAASDLKYIIDDYKRNLKSRD